jgi:uncharacterized phage-associated protein
MTTPQAHLAAPICAASTAAAVANEFLSLGQTELNIPPIDQMKLQKLLFYAHGWYLALCDKPLFEEDFEAWPWGPVVRDIYTQTNKFGRFPVSEKLNEIRRIGEGPLDFKMVAPDGVEGEELKAFVHAIWDSHKALSGIQLSNSTHAPGEPWTIIKEQHGTLDNKPLIPNEVIAAVFKKKLADVRNSPNSATE